MSILVHLNIWTLGYSLRRHKVANALYIKIYIYKYSANFHLQYVPLVLQLKIILFNLNSTSSRKYFFSLSQF